MTFFPTRDELEISQAVCLGWYLTTHFGTKVTSDRPSSIARVFFWSRENSPNSLSPARGLSPFDAILKIDTYGNTLGRRWWEPPSRQMNVSLIFGVEGVGEWRDLKRVGRGLE